MIAEVQKIEGVEERPSPVAGGSSLVYCGKEFAHFHDDHELDLRLTKAVIRELGLEHPPGSVHHPTRSTNSSWIELRFEAPSEVRRVAELVRLAVSKL